MGDSVRFEPNTPVRPGDFWEDLDKRIERVVQIVSADAEFVYYKTVPANMRATEVRSRRGRFVKAFRFLRPGDKSHA